MRLVLDNIIFSLQNAGGISTYWVELIARLLKHDEEVGFIDRPNTNVAAKELSIGAGRFIASIATPLIMQRFLNPKLPQIKAPFIFHSSYNRICSNNKARNVTTVHDFVHEHFYAGIRKFLHSSQKSMAIKNADVIITVSENTKQDLLQYHPFLDEKKVKVVYNGVSDDFYSQPKTADVGRPFLLYVGSREKYKNFDFVVNLTRKINDFDLYIVGEDFTRTECGMLKKIAGRFKLFSRITNVQLNNLYNSAFALVHPSSYEGFGITLIEAMKAGLPFIALNRSSIPEVCGGAGLLADELDMDVFIQMLREIDTQRDRYVQNGFKQASLFSWDACYEQTLGVYNSLA